MGISHASRRSAALLFLFAAACAGESGRDGTNGRDGTSASVVVTDEPAGPNCPAGGKRITVQDGAGAPTVTYVCNGQAGSDLAWDATSTATVARPNHGYFAAGALRPTIQLPASGGLNLGDEVDVVGVGTGGFAVVPAAGQRILFGEGVTPLPGNHWSPRETPRYWRAVASSADGTRLVAAVQSGRLYTSDDSGATWTARDSNRNWVHLASSADGTKLVAAVYQGQLYTSTDSGATWTARETSRFWTLVASSADGTKLVAAEQVGRLYTSDDSGATWTPRDASRNWYSIASSADGTRLLAAVNGGQLYTSSDSGATWTPRDASRGWAAVASSADGTRLVAAANDAQGSGRLYTSDDAGTTWTVRGDARESWSSLVSSGDRTKLAGIGCRAVLVCDLYTSSDAGATWTVREVTPVVAGSSLDWSSVASSADGTRLLASARNDALFTSTAPSGNTALLDGGFGARAQLTYTGGDTWIVSGTLGAISAY